MTGRGYAAACVTADPGLRAFLRSALRGFRLKFFPSASAFLASAPRGGLAVLHEGLPDMSGRDLVAVLRGDKKTAGMLLVLARSGGYSPAEAAMSLDNGADEYFGFPSDGALLRARLANLLDRAASAAPGPGGPAEYSFGALAVSPEARTASVAGRRLRLTALEFDILLFFLRNQGRVVSRAVLLERVWRDGASAGPRSVDKRIEALRSKLGRSFGSKVRTVFGLGYIFKL